MICCEKTEFLATHGVDSKIKVGDLKTKGLNAKALNDIPVINFHGNQ